MKNLEDELRELYRAVTDTIREEDLPGLHEKRARPRRFRLGRFSVGQFGAFAPLAAAAAVVVAIGIGVAVPKLVSSPSPSRATTVTPPTSAGPTPPFMVVMKKPGSPGPEVVVVSAATGRTTASLPAPKANTVWSDVEATGSGTTFVLAAAPTRGGLCNPTYLYMLKLSASGKVASLRPWTYPVVPAEIVSLAASADGKTLAFVSDLCRGAGQDIGIIRDRTIRMWQENSLLNAGDLSLVDGGNELVYTDGPIGGQSDVRMLDTDSAPGSATAASKVLYTCPAAGRACFVVVEEDLTTMDVSWITGFDTFHLTGYRLDPGGVQSTLFSRTMSGEFIYRAGGQLMVWNPSISLYLANPVTGKATRIRTPWLNAWGITW
jgi:hypothetical protein